MSIFYLIDYQSKTYVGEYADGSSKSVTYWTQHHLMDNIYWRNDEDIQKEIGKDKMFSGTFGDKKDKKSDSDALDAAIELALKTNAKGFFTQCSSIAYEADTVKSNLIASLDSFLNRHPEICPYRKEKNNKGQAFYDRFYYWFNFKNSNDDLKTIEMLLMYVAQKDHTLWNVRDNFGSLTTPEQRFTVKYIIDKDKDAGEFSLSLNYGFKLDKLEGELTKVINQIIQQKMFTNRYGVSVVDISKRTASEIVEKITTPITKATVKNFIRQLENYKQKVIVSSGLRKESDLISKLNEGIKYMNTYLTSGKKSDLVASKQNTSYSDFIEDIRKSIFSKIPVSKKMDLVSVKFAEKFVKSLLQWFKETSLQSLLGNGVPMKMDWLSNYYNNLYCKYVSVKFCSMLGDSYMQGGYLPLQNPRNANSYLMSRTKVELEKLQLPKDSIPKINRLLLSCWHSLKYGAWKKVFLTEIRENVKIDKEVFVTDRLLQYPDVFYYSTNGFIKEDIENIKITSKLDMARKLSDLLGYPWVYKG